MTSIPFRLSTYVSSLYNIYSVHNRKQYNIPIPDDKYVSFFTDRIFFRIIPMFFNMSIRNFNNIMATVIIQMIVETILF